MHWVVSCRVKCASPVPGLSATRVSERPIVAVSTFFNPFSVEANYDKVRACLPSNTFLKVHAIGKIPLSGIFEHTKCHDGCRLCWLRIEYIFRCHFTPGCLLLRFPFHCTSMCCKSENIGSPQGMKHFPLVIHTYWKPILALPPQRFRLGSAIGGLFPRSWCLYHALR